MTAEALRVLVIDDRVPSRVLGAGFPRMLDLLGDLCEQGLDVTLAPAITGPTTEELRELGVAVVAETPDAHVASGPQYDVVVISRPHNWRFAGACRAHQPDAALLYDGEALFFRRLEQQATLVPPDVARDLVSEAARQRAVEQLVAREADAICSISAEEAAWFRAEGTGAPVWVVPPIARGATPSPAGYWDRRDAVFVAGWSSGADSPNGDALVWLSSEVLPVLSVLLPWARIRVTGGTPPEPLDKLEDPNLSFVGEVENIADVYASARVAVAPVRYGAGVKIKIVEALAHGVPVVTTTIGRDGLPDEWTSLVDIADDPAEFARLVVRFLEDPRAWERRRAEIVPLPDLADRPERLPLSGAVRAAYELKRARRAPGAVSSS